VPLRWHSPKLIREVKHSMKTLSIVSLLIGAAVGLATYNPQEFAPPATSVRDLTEQEMTHVMGAGYCQTCGTGCNFANQCIARESFGFYLHTWVQQWNAHPECRPSWPTDHCDKRALLDCKREQINILPTCEISSSWVQTNDCI
jgi:hypothetical protein